jgi:hypothetical protein
MGVKDERSLLAQTRNAHADAWTLYQRRGWAPWPVCGKR